MNTKVRGWCITLNNPTLDEEALAYELQWSSQIRYGVFGAEVGETGTRHLQGFLYYKNAVRFQTVADVFDGRAHIEKMRGTPEEASTYCKKDGDFFEFGDLPMSQADKGEKGKVSAEERWALAKEGRFEELPPENIKIYEYIHAKYMEAEDLTGPLDNIWLYGPAGCGKSLYVRTNYPSHYWKGMNKWWDGYQGEEVVVLDDMDPDHGKFIGYYLKIWGDRYKFNAEVKGGMLNIRPKKIIVTSQYRMDQVFPDPTCFAAVNRRFKTLQWDGFNFVNEMQATLNFHAAFLPPHIPSYHTLPAISPPPGLERSAVLTLRDLSESVATELDEELGSVMEMFRDPSVTDSF